MTTSLYPTSETNVGKTERRVSTLGGAAMALLALVKPSALTIPMLLGGGYLIYRGVTGKCLMYRAMGIQRDGSDGRTGGIKVRHAFTINRPRQEVYAYWRDFTNLALFMKHLESVRPTGEKTSHWLAKAPLGKSVEWDAEIYDEIPGKQISWRSLPGSQVMNQGTVRFKDAPGGRGTEVYVSMSYEPPGGSAAAAVAKIFGEEPDIQIRSDLRRFKEILEAGEVATTKGQASGRIKEVAQERGEINHKRNLDVVMVASEDSFPASDPPGWTTAGI